MPSATEILSIFISSELDSLGFSREKVLRRAELYRRRSKAKAEATKRILKCEHTEKIIAGSRIEGIALNSSDTDVLQVNQEIVCVKDETDFCHDKSRKLIIKADDHGAPPGYVFLTVSEEKMKRNDLSWINSLKECLEQSSSSGTMNISGDKYMGQLKREDMTNLNCWQRELTEYSDRSGPAIPKLIELLDVKIDIVAAFPYVSSNQIRAWQQRFRAFDWPPKKLIENSTNQQWYVVPVSQTGSSFEEFQWRISFNETETSLVHSMTDTQLKVFVLLRLVAKNILEPLSDEITSYVIKNTVFWVMESQPIINFSPETLIDRLEDCLVFLRKGIENREIQTYMLPERNLFDVKLKDTETTDQLRTAIDDVIEEGLKGIAQFMKQRNRLSNFHMSNPSGYNLWKSLHQANMANDITEEKMSAISDQSLIDLNVAVYESNFRWMLPYYDLLYFTYPYIRKYGIPQFVARIFAIKFCQEQGYVLKSVEDNMPEKEADSYSVTEKRRDREDTQRKSHFHSNFTINLSMGQLLLGAFGKYRFLLGAFVLFAVAAGLGLSMFTKFPSVTNCLSTILIVFGIATVPSITRTILRVVKAWLSVFSDLRVVWSSVQILARVIIHIGVIISLWYMLRYHVLSVFNESQLPYWPFYANIAGCVALGMYGISIWKNIILTILTLLYVISYFTVVTYKTVVSNQQTFSEMLSNMEMSSQGRCVSAEEFMAFRDKTYFLFQKHEKRLEYLHVYVHEYVAEMLNRSTNSMT